MLGDQVGFHSFWTVEHHFLEEYSHCSNPEMLYGAIAARTENIRIGYGVRLLPQPYNHPIRTAESVAVLDLLSDGRVEFGTGRSSTRAELEGFDVDPHETREMWSRGARAHRRRVDRTTSTRPTASTGAWAPRAACSRKPLQKPHPPIWGATSSPDGHHEIGRHGIGLCSFTVGVPPEELTERIDALPRGPGRVHAAGGQVRQRPGRDLHDGALRATPTKRPTPSPRSRSSGTCKTAVRHIASLADWLEGKDLGTYAYAEQMQQRATATGCSTSSPSTTCTTAAPRVVGDPDRVHRDRQALRGGRLRPAALPGQPVQDPARRGHAVDRAARQARHPRVRLRTHMKSIAMTVAYSLISRLPGYFDPHLSRRIADRSIGG